jgi:glutathione S-transferase
MYRLYGAPGRASAAPEAVLEEIGAPYDYVHTEPSEAGSDYLRLHPLRQVPTLTCGELVVWEAAAICLFLAERHPESGLLPAPATSERALAYQWLHFFSSSLQPTFMRAFYPDRFCDDAQGAERVRAQACATLPSLWQVVDAALARGSGEHLVAGTLSICDLYLIMLASWHVELEQEVGSQVHRLAGIERLLRAVTARPATRRMLDRNTDSRVRARLVGDS